MERNLMRNTVKTKEITKPTMTKEMAVSALLNSDPDKNTLQYREYLLQSINRYDKYKFEWNGVPFSLDLANYVYDSSFEVAPVAVPSRITKCIKMIDELPQSFSKKCSKEAVFELMASILFAYKNKKIWGITEIYREEIFKVVHQCNPKFSEKACEYAYKLLIYRSFII